jgi:hypothetical protein
MLIDRPAGRHRIPRLPDEKQAHQHEDRNRNEDQGVAKHKSARDGSGKSNVIWLGFAGHRWTQ